MMDDMSQYLGVFLDEATEQLELLERDILLLEQNPSQELLNGIFRAAHTLKGSSRAMGFTAMGELTHAMEDVFDQLRQNKLTVTRELVDALFAGLDMLKAMTEEIAAQGATELDASELTARLRQTLEQKTGAAPEGTPPPAPATASPETTAADPEDTAPPVPAFTLTDAQKTAVQEAQRTGLTLLTLQVRLAPDCLMKSVRAMMVLQALEQVGTLLATRPDEDALDNEEFENHFDVLIATEREDDAVAAAARGVNEVQDVRVRPFTLPQDTPATTGPAPEPAAPSRREARNTPPVVDERRIDAGPEARGKSPEEVQKIAAEKKQAQTVRVDVTRLDTLLNLVGELVMDRNRIAQLCGQLSLQVAANDILDSLQETAAHVGRITDELQEEIMKARMLPISNVFSRFPRMVRDLAQKLNKEVDFLVEGGETELDRSVIEVIGDPLIHMLRNSVDHGIELPEEREQAGKPRIGTVRLAACHAENHIVITIEDDGRGMDPEKLRASAVKKGLLTEEAAARLSDREALNIIFMPGFSTAKVVSDVSGRGVGMDIVRSNLQKLGAQIDIESRPGAGSRFTIKMPLTLAIIRGLLVHVAGGVYAMPLASVVETIRIAESDIHLVNHQEVIMQRGRVLPIIRLREVFQLDQGVTPAERALYMMEPASAEPVMDPDAPAEAPAKRSRRSGARAAQRTTRSSAARKTTRAASTETADVAVVRERASEPDAVRYVVIVGHAGKHYGLMVDTLIGEQEVVIKTLGKFLGEIPGISGATILGDGRVALIMDINGVVACAAAEKGKVHAA